MAVASYVDRAARLLRAACISTPESRRSVYRRLAGLSRAETGIIAALAIFLGGAVASAGAAAVDAAQATTPVDRSAPAKASSKATVANPGWKDLSALQQQTLSPLATEWDKLDAPHKAKWLEISRRHATLKPEDQTRMQERMRAWVALTPEQRRVARESYARTKKLNTDQKSAQWQQYQQLPEEQKKTLAAEAAKNKVAALPSVHSKAKTVAPIKSASKPILQQSVLPSSPAARAGAAAAAGTTAAPVSPTGSAAVPAPTAPAVPAAAAPAAPVAAGATPGEH